MAAAVKARLGIPYIFTAHSLGRVKQVAFGTDCAETAGPVRTSPHRRMARPYRIVWLDPGSVGIDDMDIPPGTCSG